MLRTLQEEDKIKWLDFVQPLLHAYNCMKNDTAGFSPYQLMFRRQPSLPIDVAFGIKPEGEKRVSHVDYVKKLQESLQESYKIAVEYSKKTVLRNKQRYDLKVRESTLQAGDRVLVKNVGIRAKHKIADRWSKTIYQVVKQIADSPVYVIKSLTNEGPERTLHRDLLLPCGFLTPTYSSDEDNRMEGKEKTTCSREPLIVPEDDDEQAYDSDGEPDFYFPQIMQDKTYPSIMIVKDVPYIIEVEGSSCETTLNPNAQPFEPFGGVESLDIEFEHV